MSARWPMIAAAALALSLGWGIRGNFGHETGAMIPGALAAMAAVLLSGRLDWQGRIPWFAFFGALGWSFGGSISYMQVIGYTHSAQSASVLYGYACLFVIGFLWGALGGAGTALPAVLDRERLHGMFPVIIAVFAAWQAQDWAVAWFVDLDPQFRQRDPLYWYDTDWLGAAVAIAAVLLLAAIRRKWDFASSLILHMAIGWWIGFLVLVVLLGWRMTPPRGDNWAGCAGMVAGLLVFFQRQRLPVLGYSAVFAGTIGGIGFAAANLLKLLGIKTGWSANWHSVLEQTYGLINGVGIGWLIWILARRLPEPREASSQRSWTQPFSAFFVLVIITYFNFFKSVGTWTKSGAMPENLYFMSALAWFNAAYLALAILIAAILWAHWRRPLEIFPASAKGRGQLLFIIFLWWVVAGNFGRALVGFAPQRLMTEGVIFLNAALCTALVLMHRGAAPEAETPEFKVSRALGGCAAALALTSFVCWGLTRAAFGSTFAGHAAKHVRFGPDATATSEKPAADKPHP